MANVTFYEPTDMSKFDWFWEPPTVPQDLTKSAIRVGDRTPPADTTTAIYRGSFNYGFFQPEGATGGDKLGVISGTLTGYDLYVHDVIRVHITDLNFDVVTALIYVDLGTDVENYAGYDVELLSLLLAENDSISGSAFNDKLLGFDGNDTINGGARHDTLMGGNGVDQMNGGFGSDTLIGGAGKDSSSGGAGTDVFSFTTVSSAKGDTVLDFSQAQNDALSFAGLGLSFIGAGAFTGSGHEIRFAHAGGNTLVQIDLNGDKAADATITLIGSYTLHTADFIL
jgi:hypothetical protein